MKICTFKSENAPEAVSWCARILVRGKFLPTAMHGATEDAAAGKAKEFWNEEVERRSKKQPKNKAQPKPAAPVAKETSLDDLLG